MSADAAGQQRLVSGASLRSLSVCSSGNGKSVGACAVQSRAVRIMERGNRLRLLRVLAGAFLSPGNAPAETAAKRPNYKVIRYEEDWAALRNG